MNKSKLWGGRFTEDNSELFLSYTASINYDQKLAEEDIIGSLAHVNMLNYCKLINQEEAKEIQSGLVSLLEQWKRAELEFSETDEDIHMNIERLLTEEIGQVAGKLHTARSRNDQVALDVHLYLRQQTTHVAELLINLVKILVKVSKNNLDVVMPGYTHLQHAQPVLFSHHLLAYAQMFRRDLDRFLDAYKRINLCPLGAGALAGTGLAIDRDYLAKLLKFYSPTENSMDTVSNRDSYLDFLYNTAVCFSHLSRFCEDLILWSSYEFQFVELSDDFCTGSSMMPQKKNPDLAELIRGKTGRTYGNLTTLLSVVKSLSLTYFKDLQEDKEPLFDSVETILPALKLFAEMIDKMKIKKDNMADSLEKDFSNVTDAADYLVTKGTPFREAHEICGQLVKKCVSDKKFFSELSLTELHEYSKDFNKDFFDFIKPNNVINRRTSYGGTGTEAVKQQIKNLETKIDAVDLNRFKVTLKVEDLLIS